MLVFGVLLMTRAGAAMQIAVDWTSGIRIDRGLGGVWLGSTAESSREGIVSTEIDWVFRDDIAGRGFRELSWRGVRADSLPDEFRLDGSVE